MIDIMAKNSNLKIEKGEKMKKKACFAFLCIMLLVCACGKSGDLSKGDARDILEKHFKDFYSIFLPQEIAFTFQAPWNYKNVLLAKRMGMVIVKQTSSALGQFGMGNDIEKPGMGDNFSITLTKKGRGYKHLNTADGNICFLIGKITLNDIVDLKKEANGEFTVLFSFTLSLNELGRELMSSLYSNSVNSSGSESCRGKAVISYDPFIKDFLLKKILSSEWKKENWMPMPWIDYVNGKQVVVVAP